MQLILTTLQIRCHVQFYRTLDVGYLAGQGCFPFCRFGCSVSPIQSARVFNDLQAQRNRSCLVHHA